MCGKPAERASSLFSQRQRLPAAEMLMAVLIAADERLKHLFYYLIRVWPAEAPSLLVLNYEGIDISLPLQKGPHESPALPRSPAPPRSAEGCELGKLTSSLVGQRAADLCCYRTLNRTSVSLSVSATADK